MADGNWNEIGTHVLAELERLHGRLDRLEASLMTKVEDVTERSVRTEAKQAVLEANP